MSDVLDPKKNSTALARHLRIARNQFGMGLLALLAVVAWRGATGHLTLKLVAGTAVCLVIVLVAHVAAQHFERSGA